jgi:hypothetical protein
VNVKDTGSRSFNFLAQPQTIIFAEKIIMIRALPLYLLCIVLLTSCAPVYQYGTISSSNLEKNDKQEFVMENDSVRVLYNFHGMNAPLTITVKNKLQVPMYIDWQRSSLIINDSAVSFIPREIAIQGNYDGTASRYVTTPRSISGNINAVAERPELLTFIPPQAYVTQKPVSVVTRMLYAPSDSAYETITFQKPGTLVMKVKRAHFADANSPLHFKTYLTIRVGEQTQQDIRLHHAFYVSEIQNTNSYLGESGMSATPLGNQYHH